MKFIIERYDPDKDQKPYFKEYDIQLEPSDRMLLDALIRIKSIDDSLALRRSCREGVCGSDAMNINGRNGHSGRSGFDLVFVFEVIGEFAHLLYGKAYELVAEGFDVCHLADCYLVGKTDCTWKRNELEVRAMHASPVPKYHAWARASRAFTRPAIFWPPPPCSEPMTFLMGLCSSAMISPMSSSLPLSLESTAT